MFRLALTLFLLQSGFHAFTASLPVALAGAGVSDPKIGLVVGSAGVALIPAAFIVGMLLDRLGGALVLYAGAVAYLLGSLILIAAGADLSASNLELFAARICQGIGYAATLPAALSLVPRVARANRRGIGIALMNSADTLTILAVPPLSLAILATSTLRGVAVGSIGLVLFGVLVGLGVGRQLHSESRPPRPFGFRMRRAWLVPLSIALFYMVHWGVLSAYLPSRAERAGADIGPFFICDGVAVLISRPLIGWLTDRVGGHRLVLIGLALTVAGVIVALLPPTAPSILVVGLFTGFGGSSAITPLQVDLSYRSDDTDRGSAFALLSAAMSGGLLLGSAGLSPIVAIWGFEGAALVAIGGLGLPAMVILREPSAWVARPRH